MPILTVKDAARSYGNSEVLRAATLAIEEGERVGLVGRNGSGKTTLARIVARREDPDAGEVVWRAGLRVAYLEQDPVFEPGRSAVDAVLDGLPQWRAAMRRHGELSERLATATGDLDALLLAHADAEAEIERWGGWDQQHAAAAVLGRLGIDPVDRPVHSMSGGERRRVALAQIMIAPLDLAILDEPTNHLDVETVEWLEEWLLRRFHGALLLVTHDRYLLDRVTTRTLDVERGTVESYEGGWGRYLVAKSEHQAHLERTDANRRNFLRRELEWLRRNPKARSTKQKARVDRIEAVIDQPNVTTVREADISVGAARTGKMILEAENVAVDVAGRRLVSDLTLRLSPGERIGVVGPNGCGKTSLIRVLTGRASPARGEVQLGKNTRIAYLDQQRAGLDDEASVFDNVAEGRSRVVVGGQEVDVRTYLERFLFDGNEQRQRVGTLSGGERARVALARILRQDANLVVLDEPTNDLDVLTLAALEEALLEFAGTILFVTHDRWFLDRVATSLLVFNGSEVTRYEGGYSDYLERRPSKLELATRTPGAAKPTASASPSSAKSKRLTYGETLELEGLLDRVDQAERQVASLAQEVSQPDFYQRGEKARRDVFERLDQARAEAERLAERWTELESRRDG